MHASDRTGRGGGRGAAGYCRGSGRNPLMVRPGQHLLVTGGWRIEPVGEWCAARPEQIEEIVRQVVRAIEGAESRLYYRSRHAVTYRTQIAAAAGETLELYVKTYDAPR